MTPSWRREPPGGGLPPGGGTRSDCDPTMVAMAEPETTVERMYLQKLLIRNYNQFSPDGLFRKLSRNML